MANITATGTRGFLLWLKEFQPAVYAKIAPTLPAQAPDLFTEFESAGGALGAYSRGLNGLGSNGSGTDVSLQPISISSFDTSVPTVDVASAANSSGPSSSTSSWLSSLINGVSSAYMGYTQAQNQQAIVNAQLQRAQAGLPPLDIAPGANGIPTISVSSITSSPVLWIAGGALVIGVFLFASRGRR
jgi:hypothetical protein